MFIIQCDKCKKKAEPRRDTGWPTGWRKIQYRLQEYGSQATIYHICASCAKELKLPEDVKASLSDQFLDIITDLATDAVDDAIANQ